jgi:hypothetical protein
MSCGDLTGARDVLSGFTRDSKREGMSHLASRIEVMIVR